MLSLNPWKLAEICSLWEQKEIIRLLIYCIWMAESGGAVLVSADCEADKQPNKQWWI